MTHLTRRAFLQLAGITTVAAATGCQATSGRTLAQSLPTPPPFGPADVKLTLTAQITDWELAPTKIIQAWTYNGTLPGELIRVREGQRVRVNFRNELPEATTIHWHGIDVPFAMDGVPNVSQPPVLPGASFTYEFVATPAGTRWYHTHTNSEMQMDAGLSGAFLIEPANPDAGAAVDQEYTLLLDDFISNRNPSDAAQPQSGRNGMMGGMMQGGMMQGGMMQGMMGGNPRVDTAYDTFTINGKAYPATEPLVVRRGDRVRLRLVNASNMQTFVMRLLGHTLEVTHVDGNPLRAPVPVDAVPIATAERYDVVFTADNPGRWPLYALDQEHRNGGLLTEIVYAGVESSLVAPPPTENNLRIFGYEMADGIDFLPPVDGRRDFSLTLSGGGMMGTGPDEWTINGGTMATLDPLHLARNQLGVVRMVNMSAQSHPMHLHGQSFRVVAVNGVHLRSPLVKDTVDIAPHMGSADIEFAAFNPGRWMFHCHKPMHMEGGMGVMVEVA